MKAKRIKFISVGYYIIVSILILLAVLFIFSMLPIPGNYKIMTVLSGSMEPTIHPGSIVVSKPLNSYKIGDIITFEDEEDIRIPTTHRIVEIELAQGIPVYTTQGDANDTPDRNSVSQNMVIGKVILNVPFLGYAVNFIKKPLGFILIIIIPAGIIIIDEIKKIYKEIKKRKDNNE